MADSSITTSLALLGRIARERADHEEQARLRADRKARIDQLVQYRLARRVEQGRERAEAERRHRERVEAQREAARREGIREGEKVRAAIEAQHDAEMRLMALRHQRELEARRPLPAPRSRARVGWLALIGGAALLVGALWSGPPTAPEASSWLTATAAARAEVASMAAEQRALTRDKRALEEELASLQQPAPAAPEATLPPPAPARWTPARQPARPAPAAPAACTDGIGDPCCAFGEIVC